MGFTFCEAHRSLDAAATRRDDGKPQITIIERRTMRTMKTAKRLIRWIARVRTPETEEILRRQQALANAMLCSMI